jgi:hypothetical protein
MNTATAATTAGVTIPTIRTWCRTGVIGAVKAAGRWVIDTASLTHRITIGAMRARKPATMQLDLTATYTITDGPRADTTITPKIRHKQLGAEHRIIIRDIAPLLADRIDAIADLGDRLHTLEVLMGAIITISDQAGEPIARSAATRDSGRILTTYAGTRDLPVSVVLDLAEQLRTQLAAA